MPTDQEIAGRCIKQPITQIAHSLGIDQDDLELYGKYKAKLPLKLIDDTRSGSSKLILVSATSPTPAGEGKTTVSIGLSEGMNQLGLKTTVVLREPSLGPVFGMKGGATGGGHAQVVPMEDINLHFTGDFSAVEKANNLLAALIDNNIQSKIKSLNLDPRTIKWKRVMDMNDRALRDTVIGLGGVFSGIPRETGFDITAASEIMAILCLASDLEDLKERMGNIFVGFTFDRKPVYARDLNAHGAMAALMKDAIKPNLVQTLEGNPAIIHGGPFANIAQGTNSVIATKMGLSLSDYVVTEAGFGFDLGAEKFFDIKCRTAGLQPSAVVLVTTIRALKYHGKKSLKELTDADADAVSHGLVNLEKHMENIRLFDVPAIVAINKFSDDTDEEIKVVQDFCASKGVKAIVADVWGQGGAGALDLAGAVEDVCKDPAKPFKPLYPLEASLHDKIEMVATKLYGAKAIDYASSAKRALRWIDRLELSHLPVCIAKTQKSLSDNPKLLGRPKDFVVTVRDIEIAAGAGFLIPITGDILRMPGLPASPAANNIDIDQDGEITGMF